MPRILLKERGAFKNADTGGTWLLSAHAIRCWVKSRAQPSCIIYWFTCLLIWIKENLWFSGLLLKLWFHGLLHCNPYYTSINTWVRYPYIGYSAIQPNITDWWLIYWRIIMDYIVPFLVIHMDYILSLSI